MDLETFYKENYSIVYGYLFSLCGDTHLAEDLTSETFLKAIIKIDSYDGGVKASTWLCTIGRNLYLNERKKRRRHVSLEGIVIPEETTMEEKYIENQRSQTILRLAEKLGEPKNQVFRMRLQGMSFREIGEALGKGESWARVTFFRAKERIVEELEGME